MTYFHGTDAQLEIGDVLVPGALIGKDYGRSNHVYITLNDPEKALSWAKTAASMSDTPSMVYVYTVEPVGAVEEDEACDDGAGEESFRTSSAVITGFYTVSCLLND